MMMVIDDIPIGIHTGAIQGRGIRKRTSMVAKLGGHLNHSYSLSMGHGNATKS